MIGSTVIFSVAGTFILRGKKDEKVMISFFDKKQSDQNLFMLWESLMLTLITIEFDNVIYLFIKMNSF